MRATLTIDGELLALVRAVAEEQRISLEDAIDDVIRRGLQAEGTHSRLRAQFRVQPFRSAFSPEVDPLRLNELADDLDVAQFADAD